MVKDLIQCINVHRHFHGAEKVSVLRGIDFSVKKGDTVSIEGASGSGKSTLLLILAGLDNPNKGQLFLFGRIREEIAALDMLRIRNSLIGVVYQHHHLLPEFSIVENVAMPLLIRGLEKREAIKSARRALSRVNLADRHNHRPSQLSGGECQRAAIARALIIEPELILADEPTGNLDSFNADVISKLLLELCEENGTAIVVATHDMAMSAKMNRRYTLSHGRLAVKT